MHHIERLAREFRRQQMAAPTAVVVLCLSRMPLQSMSRLIWRRTPINLLLGPCLDVKGHQLPLDSPDYKSCAQQLAERDYKTDYSETKDLIKTLLSLEVGVFAVLVAFSEKIFHPEKNPGRWPKFFTGAAWASLFSSIMLGWIALDYLVAGLEKEFLLYRSALLLWRRAVDYFARVRGAFRVRVSDVVVPPDIFLAPPSPIRIRLPDYSALSVSVRSRFHVGSACSFHIRLLFAHGVECQEWRGGAP